MSKLICIGVINKPHGVKGYVTLTSYTQDPYNIFKLPVVLHCTKPIKLHLLSAKTENRFICSIQGICSRSEAEEFTNHNLFVQRANLPKLQDEEFYIDDLKGRELFDSNNQRIGAIIDVHNFGAGDIIEVKFLDGDSHMFPFSNRIFEVFDGKVIFIAPEVY